MKMAEDMGIFIEDLEKIVSSLDRDVSFFGAGIGLLLNANFHENNEFKKVGGVIIIACTIKMTYDYLRIHKRINKYSDNPKAYFNKYHHNKKIEVLSKGLNEKIKHEIKDYIWNHFANRLLCYTPLNSSIAILGVNTYLYLIDKFTFNIKETAVAVLSLYYSSKRTPKALVSRLSMEKYFSDLKRI